MLLGHRVSRGIEKLIPALKAIRDHRGVTVPNLGTRKGHRAVVVPGKGGKQEKGAPSGDIWLTLMSLMHDRSSTQLL